MYHGACGHGNVQQHSLSVATTTFILQRTAKQHFLEPSRGRINREPKQLRSVNNRTTSSHRLVQKLLIQLAIAPPTTVVLRAYNVGSCLVCEATYVCTLHCYCTSFLVQYQAVVLGLVTRDGGENRSRYDECLREDLYTY